MTNEQKQFLNQYLLTLPKNQQTLNDEVVAEHYCNDEWHANECARLILHGKKTASCSLEPAYAIEQETLPKVGQLRMVLDCAQHPICIIQIVDVST